MTDRSPDASPERVLRGIGVTQGIAIAPLHVLGAGELTAGNRAKGSPDEEGAALGTALAKAIEDLAQLVAKLDDEAGAILEFQMVLAEDDELVAPALELTEAGEPADRAWCEVMDREIAEYANSGDEVLAARAADLGDLKSRVLNYLHGLDSGDSSAQPLNTAILVSTDIAPSRFLAFDPGRIAGIALEQGSRTSHVALLARARGIPMVSGLANLGPVAELGAYRGDAVLDVTGARLILNPAAHTLSEVRRSAQVFETIRARAEDFVSRPAVTGWGERIGVMVNIDHPSLLDAVQSDHCDGIGLTRTEFLFSHGLPDEDTQVAAYIRLIEWADGRPVTVRTLDAGGDKPVQGLEQPEENNPFLGVRGLRLSLVTPAVFAVQLRALMRAAARGPLKIMVPMVTEPSELETVRAMMDELAVALGREGVEHTRPPLGMMVEVPAAALSAASFDADFYSIGSNDLIQYATASARDNAAVAPLARGEHPGVLALIEATVKAGAGRGVEVSLCGDMASDPAQAERLVGLGLRTLSVAPAMVGPVKAALAALNNAESKP